MLALTTGYHWQINHFFVHQSWHGSTDLEIWRLLPTKVKPHWPWNTGTPPTDDALSTIAPKTHYFWFLFVLFEHLSWKSVWALHQREIRLALFQVRKLTRGCPCAHRDIHLRGDTIGENISRNSIALMKTCTLEPNVFEHCASGFFTFLIWLLGKWHEALMRGVADDGAANCKAFEPPELWNEWDDATFWIPLACTPHTSCQGIAVIIHQHKPFEVRRTPPAEGCHRRKLRSNGGLKMPNGSSTTVFLFNESPTLPF